MRPVLKLMATPREHGEDRLKSSRPDTVLSVARLSAKPLLPTGSFD